MALRFHGSGLTLDSHSPDGYGLTLPFSQSSPDIHPGGGTTWTVSASTGTGEGTLALYVVDSVGVTDVAGNPVAALPVIGPHYAVDHVNPQAAKLTTNTLVVANANAGPNGFQVTVTFNEPSAGVVDAADFLQFRNRYLLTYLV